MEQPNLNYIDQLARGDESVRNTLINVIKTEFPGELEVYYNSVQQKDFKRIEQNVHRIKHKFSILGLESSYKRANEFEQELRKQHLSSAHKNDFEKILLKISQYLKTI